MMRINLLALRSRRVSNIRLHVAIKTASIGANTLSALYSSAYETHGPRFRAHWNATCSRNPIETLSFGWSYFVSVIHIVRTSLELLRIKGLRWPSGLIAHLPFTSEAAGSSLSENFLNATRTQSSYEKSKSQRSATSRGFSTGTPVSSHRESWQGGLGKRAHSNWHMLLWWPCPSWQS
jgi:hypothetical protein